MQCELGHFWDIRPMTSVCISECDEPNPHHQCSICSNESLSTFLGSASSHTQRYNKHKTKCCLSSTHICFDMKNVCFYSTGCPGEVSWPALGDDGSQRSERHQSGLVAHASCCWRSQSLWVTLPDLLQRLHGRWCSCNIHIQRFDSFHLSVSPSLSDLGSVSSCDAFLNIFQAHGLKPEVICPCATSPEAMTVAMRRYIMLLTNCRDPCLKH